MLFISSQSKCVNRFFQSTPVYWPSEKDEPMVMAQVTVSLLTEDELEEGEIQMMEFEIKINSKVNRECDIHIFVRFPKAGNV